RELGFKHVYPQRSEAAGRLDDNTPLLRGREAFGLRVQREGERLQKERHLIMATALSHFLDQRFLSGGSGGLRMAVDEQLDACGAAPGDLLDPPSRKNLALARRGHTGIASLLHGNEQATLRINSIAGDSRRESILGIEQNPRRRRGESAG